MAVDFVMINNYLIDVALREDHVFDADVTDYPTEASGSFSDNIRKKPIRVTIDGIVSNSPLGSIATSRRFFAGPLATGKASAQEAYVLLLAVWNAQEPVTIRTSLATFERMAMTSLSIPKSREVGDALHFTAQFQQIQVIENERVRLRAGGARKSIRGGGKKRNRGPQVSEAHRGKQIIWSKGLPPGSENIYEQVIVLYYPKAAAGSAIGQPAPTSSGALYHWSPGPRFQQQLSPDEVRALKLDMERDRKWKQEGARGSWWNEYDADDVTKKPVTKTPAMSSKLNQNNDPVGDVFKRLNNLHL